MGKRTAALTGTAAFTGTAALTGTAGGTGTGGGGGTAGAAGGTTWEAAFQAFGMDEEDEMMEKVNSAILSTRKLGGKNPQPT